MKVKDLIEKLQEYDDNFEVKYLEISDFNIYHEIEIVTTDTDSKNNIFVCLE